MRKLEALSIALLALCLSPMSSRGDDKKTEKQGIAWYGSWKQGLAIAKKNKRPILLVAAAPHCHQVSGLW